MPYLFNETSLVSIEIYFYRLTASRIEVKIFIL